MKEGSNTYELERSAAYMPAPASATTPRERARRVRRCDNIVAAGPRGSRGWLHAQCEKCEVSWAGERAILPVDVVVDEKVTVILLWT